MQPVASWSTCLSAAHPYSTSTRPIWPLCLVPDALDDMSRPVSSAEKFVQTIIRRIELIIESLCVGAALFRAGKYEQAAQRLKNPLYALSQACRMV